MIIVTGGAGFIGSNVFHEPNEQGEDSILIVDNLSEAKSPQKKFLNVTAISERPRPTLSALQRG